MRSPESGCDDHRIVSPPVTPPWRLPYRHDGPGGEHTITLAGEGLDLGRSHMLRLAEQADVSVRETESIIGEVRDTVAQ